MATGKVIARVSLPTSFAGLVWSADGKRLFAGGGFDDRIYRFDHAAGLLSNKTLFDYPDKAFISQPRIWREAKNQRASGPGDYRRRQDTVCRRVVRPLGGPVRRGVGHVPRRGRPRGRELPIRPGARRDRETGSTSASGARPRWPSSTPRIQLSGDLQTEDHPNEMLLAKGGKILYVANANRNTVSVIDTEVGKPVETIGTAIDPKAPPGSTPSSLALSPDESMLLVANANTNNLAVVNVKDPGGSTPLGFIPVGWYPTSVRLHAMARRST